MRVSAASFNRSPYGAFELKSTYQRNFSYAMLITLGVIATGTGGGLLLSSDSQEPPIIIDGGVPDDLSPIGPVIIKLEPSIPRATPPSAPPEHGDFLIVADSLIAEFDSSAVPTQSELANRGVAETGSESGNELIIDESGYGDSDYPGIDEFQPLEVQPVMITESPAQYPRQAEAAGLEGVVWVAVLVGKDGSVLQKKLYVSSGIESLDEAALESAGGALFKPGIQNGHPVVCWVKYKVRFDLD